MREGKPEGFMAIADAEVDGLPVRRTERAGWGLFAAAADRLPPQLSLGPLLFTRSPYDPPAAGVVSARSALVQRVSALPDRPLDVTWLPAET